MRMCYQAICQLQNQLPCTCAKIPLGILHFSAAVKIALATISDVSRMCRMCFYNYRATGSKCTGRIATGSGIGKRKITCTKNHHGPKRHQHFSNIWFGWSFIWQWQYQSLLPASCLFHRLRHNCSIEKWFLLFRHVILLRADWFLSWLYVSIHRHMLSSSIAMALINTARCFKENFL